MNKRGRVIVHTINGHTIRLHDAHAFRIVHEESRLIHGTYLELPPLLDAAKQVCQIINKSVKRRTVDVEPKDIQKVLDAAEGTVEKYGPPPEVNGQVSRFAVAWWSDADKIKHVRIFGDRIHLTFKHPDTPRLFPFGQSAYYVLFPADDPMHCLRCRTLLQMGDGVWCPQPHEIDPAKINLVGNHFLCASCKYEQDTGLRPGINKLRKNKTKKDT